MEIHGVKVDLLGLAACITAVTSLWSMIKGQKKKEARRAGTETDDKIKPGT